MGREATERTAGAALCSQTTGCAEASRKTIAMHRDPSCRYVQQLVALQIVIGFQVSVIFLLHQQVRITFITDKPFYGSLSLFLHLLTYTVFLYN